MDPIMLDEIGARIEEVKIIAEEAKTAATQAKTAAGGYKLRDPNPYTITTIKTFSDNITSDRIMTFVDLRNVYLSQTSTGGANRYTHGQFIFDYELKMTAGKGFNMNLSPCIRIYDDNDLVGEFEQTKTLAVNSSNPNSIGQATFTLPVYVKYSRITLTAKMHNFYISGSSPIWNITVTARLNTEDKAFQLL